MRERDASGRPKRVTANGAIGAGVAKEVEAFLRRGAPVYNYDRRDGLRRGPRALAIQRVARSERYIDERREDDARGEQQTHGKVLGGQEQQRAERHEHCSPHLEH
jgi:hypothetical protein